MVDADALGASGMGCFGSPHMKFRHVFHLVRCPLLVIGAMSTHRKCSLDYASKTAGLGVSHSKDLVSLARLWLAQQNIIESYAERRFRIDEFKSMFKEICQDSGFSVEICNSDLMPKKEVQNQRPHIKVTWAEIRRLNSSVHDELLRKAKEYGFDQACTEDSERVRERVVSDQDHTVTKGFFGTESAVTGDLSLPLTSGNLTRNLSSNLTGNLSILGDNLPNTSDVPDDLDRTDNMCWVWDRDVLQRALLRKTALEI